MRPPRLAFVITLLLIVAIVAVPRTNAAHTSCANVHAYGDDNDTIIKGNECNIIYSEGGSDIVHSGGGNDDIYAGTGRDYAEGEADNDNLYGNPGDDDLAGRAGNDHVQDSQWNTGDVDYLCSGYGIDFLDMKDGEAGDSARLKDNDGLQQDANDYPEYTVECWF